MKNEHINSSHRLGASFLPKIIIEEDPSKIISIAANKIGKNPEAAAEIFLAAIYSVTEDQEIKKHIQTCFIALENTRIYTMIS